MIVFEGLCFVALLSRYRLYWSHIPGVAPFRFIVTEELLDFSVTMVVLALEPLFWYIDTEKPASFCGTIREVKLFHPLQQLLSASILHQRKPEPFLFEVLDGCADQIDHIISTVSSI